MTSAETPDSPPPVTVKTLMRNIMIAGLLIAVGIGTVAAIVGALAAGLPGIWAAAMGAAAAFVFFAVTAATMYLTAESSPTVMAAGVMAGFFVKIVAFMIAVVLLRDATFYDPWTLFLTLAAAAVASLVADMVIVQRSRLPLIDPPRESA